MATALVLTGIGGIIAIILLGVGALFGAVFGG